MHLTDHPTPTASSSGPERRDAMAQDRAARTALGHSKLLAQRPELRGVHPPADFVADAVRWSA